MAKPKRVKIGAHIYEIEYVDNVIVDREAGGLMLGQIVYRKCHIIVESGDRHATKIAETFLHEVVHAIDNDRLLELNERQVDQIASGMLEVMTNNPGVFGKHFLEIWEGKGKAK